MKKLAGSIAILFLIFALFVPVSTAQIGMLGYGREVREGLFNGGIGITTIDQESFLTISLHPEISLGKFGLGLNVDLLYNTKTGQIRKKDWNETYDYLRMIRYIRYGWKRSEEHTSELQSHSFTSYAVFCLKKKNNKYHCK